MAIIAMKNACPCCDPEQLLYVCHCLSISSRVNSRVQIMFKISRHSPVDVYYKLTHSARLSLISSRLLIDLGCIGIGAPV